MKIIIIGGGAAGFFAALTAKQTHPSSQVVIAEATKTLLAKVKVSGGGRCNVTHSCFDPKQLVQNYPRGSKELLGPFHKFQPRDTIRWFAEEGVELHTEKDGRMFPVSNSSETIIQCFLQKAKKLGVQIRTECRIRSVEKQKEGFVVEGEYFDRVILATGSAAHGYKIAKKWGHTINNPLPSLFTFNTPSSPLLSLSGVSVAKARVSIGCSRHTTEGPVLLTHWGFSGPAILKLSAFAAKDLHKCKYETELHIDWVPDLSWQQVEETIAQQPPSCHLKGCRLFAIPKKLWANLTENVDQRLSSCRKKVLQDLISRLKKDTYRIQGRTTNKEEFVTCGGVCLRQVCFQTMESRLVQGLYFAGEILDIDGITGGFNFQNAWTTGYLAGIS